ncbi:hypothetical protein INT45_005487 [Circinella minor]|uniref:Tyr recombinase domain-containing protein n=1 Tax=Circinella minor TaxID=1195481 RepID=A0A8H7VFV0_9FUNG|nr:hypothetical protein INT45_005487 [Circinella minor]
MLGNPRCGFVCRSDKPSSSSICVIETGPSGMGNECIQPLLAHLLEPIHSPAIEPNTPNSPEDSTRTDHHHSSSPVLAECDLVSSSAIPGHRSSHHLVSTSSHTNDFSFHMMALDKSELETLCVATLRRRYQLLGFSPLMGRHFAIDLNQYTTIQLIEFLQLASDSGFAPGTINLFRWAVTAFHVDPSTLSKSKELYQFLSCIKKAAPPISLTKSPVDLTPSFTFLHSIPSNTSTLLNSLSKKCAFLLAAAAFLRPSDLHRISLPDCSVDEDSHLHLIIVAPKETRQGRRINKDLVLLPLLDDVDLCPVATFEALVAHPGRSSSQFLFINSRHTDQPLAVTTLSTYIRSVLKLSPTASLNGSRLPSVRSVASDKALRNSVSLDDVLLMGNWSSSSVFNNHY